MADKPIKPSIDDEEFSLNKFDLSDPKAGSDDDDAFHHLIQDQSFESADVGQKQEPIVPDAFDNASYDMADDHAYAAVNHSLFETGSDIAEGDEGNNIHVAEDVEHLNPADDSSEPASVENTSASNPIIKLVVIAMLIVAVVVWLNLGDDSAIVEQKISLGHESAYPAIQAPASMQQAIVPSTQQDGHENNELLTMQERIVSMEKRLAEQAQELEQKSDQQSEQEVNPSQQGNVEKPRLRAVSPSTAIVRKAGSATASLPKVQLTPPPAQAVRATRQANKSGWAIVIGSVSSEAAAIKEVTRLKTKGVSADVNSITIKGKAWYRISVGGFSSRREAEGQKTYLASHLGIKGGWIHKPE